MKNKILLFFVFLSGLLLALFFGCKKVTIKVVPTVAVFTVNNITSNSAMCGGDVTSDGGESVTAKGVCWNLKESPSTSDNKTVNGMGTGSFTSPLTELNPGTTYYIRAYATNAIGTAYSGQATFTTVATVPVIKTTTVSAITSTTTISGGDITSDGGSLVTARGVCWATSPNPTIANAKTTDGKGGGSFTSNITGLLPGMTYYVMAYATNNIGTTYGNQVTLTTISVMATLTTTAVSAISSNTATSGGDITTDGGSSVLTRGVCWSTSPNPTIANSKTTDGTGSGNFISRLTGLASATTYYIRAYSTNSIGTAYGVQVTFTTQAEAPIVSTKAVSAITITTAIGGGTVTGDGGATIIAKGVCWSTTTNPTIANNITTDGTGVGTFISNIAGLALGVTYYFRAYATNSIGTTYGNEISFASGTGTVTDIDGNVYHYIIIGTQTWMVENLKTTKYRNGDPIPNVAGDWNTLATGAYCWYNNDAATYKADYGALYNWYAVADSRNIAPTGWHVPTDAEWKTLTDFLGEDVAGGKLKEAGTSHWYSPNIGATNSTGFTALPGGHRYGNAFYYIHYYGNWWSSTGYLATTARYQYTIFSYSYAHLSDLDKSVGLSVRCLRD